MNSIKILISIIFFEVIACANLALPKEKDNGQAVIANIPICEVIYRNLRTNQKPYILVRNPYKDTLWVFTTELYQEFPPRLAAHRLISFKDTITNIEAYMGIESSPMEMLTPICPFDSIKLSTYFTSIDEVKHYNNNKILYECAYFFRKDKNFEKYISRTYYNVDSNSYNMYNSQNDSTGKLFEGIFLRELKIKNSGSCK